MKLLKLPNRSFLDQTWWRTKDGSYILSSKAGNWDNEQITAITPYRSQPPEVVQELADLISVAPDMFRELIDLESYFLEKYNSTSSEKLKAEYRSHLKSIRWKLRKACGKLPPPEPKLPENLLHPKVRNIQVLSDDDIDSIREKMIETGKSKSAKTRQKNEAKKLKPVPSDEPIKFARRNQTSQK